jgi:hypothetical protein
MTLRWGLRAPGPTRLLHRPWSATDGAGSDPGDGSVLVTIDRVEREGDAFVGYGSPPVPRGNRRGPELRFRVPMGTTTPAQRWIHPADILDPERPTPAELTAGL